MGVLTRAGVAMDIYRERHHTVARLIAIGATHDHIRRQTGVSYKRISLLTADPSFKELIDHYSADIEKKWNQNVDQYLDLGMANMIRTEAMIQDKLDEADEKGDDIPLLTLNRLSQDRADRFGYPKTSQVEHKHDFAALLDRAIERSGKAKDMKVIEAIAVEVLTPVSPPSPRAVKTSSEPGPRFKPVVPPVRPSFAAILLTKRRKVA